MTSDMQFIALFAKKQIKSTNFLIYQNYCLIGSQHTNMHVPGCVESTRTDMQKYHLICKILGVIRWLHFLVLDLRTLEDL